jgi:alkylation response protein AidB-like acyl-CoA dehydrogenase
MQAEAVRAFAEEQVRESLIHRYEHREFSRDLWKKMARAGLFGLLVPPEYGGSDQDPQRFLEIIEAFILGGNDLGLALCWLDHLLIHTHVIGHFGNPEQKRRFLPGLVNGERIGAMAASEPGCGANPEKMRSRAERDQDGYRIYGQKIFITNGPVADFVIALARTAPGTDKQGISAFVLDTASPGFRAQTMELGFLNTSPHGELFFEGCVVPEANLLGAPGDGHVRISRAVFAWERFLLLVALGAHFRALLDRAVQALAGRGPPPDREVQKLVASAHVLLEGLREVCRNLAREVIERTGLDRRLLERLLFLGHSYGSWWRLLEAILQEIPAPDPLFSILIRDARLLQINQRLTDLQLARVAAGLLTQPTGHPKERPGIL